MASPSFCPPVIFAFRSVNEIPRFCEACSAAAQSSVLRNPAHASCVDMPAGTMAARRVFSEADETLDCAVVAGSLCGLDGSLCRPMVGGPGSADGIVEDCAVEDCAAACSPGPAACADPTSASAANAAIKLKERVMNDFHLARYSCFGHCNRAADPR